MTTTNVVVNGNLEIHVPDLTTDVLIIGSRFGGVYALYKFRQLNLRETVRGWFIFRWHLALESLPRSTRGLRDSVLRAIDSRGVKDMDMVGALSRP